MQNDSNGDTDNEFAEMHTSRFLLKKDYLLTAHLVEIAATSIFYVWVPTLPMHKIFSLPILIVSLDILTCYARQ